MTKTRPGRYFERTSDGRLVDRGRFPKGPAPDAVICRRVADYPNAQPPATATIGRCVHCHCAIAWNPAGPHQDAPRCCMQCVGIEPLPFEPFED